MQKQITSRCKRYDLDLQAFWEAIAEKIVISVVQEKWYQYSESHCQVRTGLSVPTDVEEREASDDLKRNYN